MEVVILKIAQVCPRYSPFIGGVETHVREISKRLVNSGYYVEVLTTDSSKNLPKEEYIDGVKVKRFTGWSPSESYHFSSSLNSYLKKNSEQFDVVHAHAYAAFPSLYAARAKGKNNFVFTPHYHGTGHTFFRSLLHVPYKVFGKSIFEKADKIICVSNYERNLVLQQFKLDEEKVVYIPNGVNLKEFEGLVKNSKSNRSILYVGRLEKYKGIQFVIEILPFIDNLIFEIVGKGPYKDNLVELAKRLDVLDRVNFYQDLPRVVLLQKYVDADILVLLSEHEAYGLSVAEALTARTPCIVANTSALEEWIGDESCVGIDYPIDTAQLLDKINFTFGKKVENRKILDWTEIVEKIIDVYQNLPCITEKD
jgi:glycosyltransferase involved in cell wall biosynthesis